MASQNEIMEVGPKVAIECIKALRLAGRPGMLWGPPGSAKSSLVKQAADELGIDFIDLRLVQIDAVDLRGLPKVIKTGEGAHEMDVSVFVQPGWLPRDGKGILFLDELPQAPTIVLNAASELLLDRRIGDYILPDGWSMMAAGNRRSDRAATGEMPSHLKNRLVHMEMTISLDEWISWGEPHGIHPEIITYLRAKPNRLHAFTDKEEHAADRLAVNTCRTWEFASDILNMNPAPSQSVQNALLMGCLGRKVALEFVAYRDRGKDLPSYKDIMADPKNAPVPKNPSQAWAVLGSIGDTGVAKDAAAIAIYLSRPEIDVDQVRPVISKLMIKQMAFKPGNKFDDEPTFLELAKKFKEA